MSEMLARLHGPAWESELMLDVTSGRRNRNSLNAAAMPSPRILADISNGSDSKENTTASDKPSNEALRLQLESVQSLLRSMDARLVSRAVELEMMEKRAIDETRKSKERLKQFDAQAHSV